MSEQQVTMKPCPHCGEQVRSDVARCKHCGGEIINRNGCVLFALIVLVFMALASVAGDYTLPTIFGGFALVVIVLIIRNLERKGILKRDD